MKKIIFIFAVCIVLFSSCATEYTPVHILEHQKERVKQLYEDKNHYDIVFMGDSLTELGDFETFIEGSKNAGVGGNYIHSTNEVIPCVVNYNPKKIYLMIGINSLFRYSFEECKDHYISLVEQLIRTFPNTEIVLESVLPMYTKNYLIECFNEYIRYVASLKGIKYLDLYSIYEVDGALPYSELVDGLHLVPSAYAKWYDAIIKDMER